MRRALVLGGSGHLGGAVVRALAARGAHVAFTFFRARERAEALARESGAAPIACDLREPAAIRDAIGALGFAPDVLAHAAGVAVPGALGAIGEADFDAAMAVNARAAFTATRALAPGMAAAGGGDVVFCGALAGIASVRAPAALAASQGALLGMTRALAKELGPSRIRVNLVVLGPLDGGIASSLDPTLLADYVKHGALQRIATATEAAALVVRLALDNTAMTGAMVPAAGV